MTQTVLIVDDSEFVREALRRALGAENDFVVIGAQNGKEALDILAQEHRVSAVVLDVQMPILDGREVLRRLGRRRDPTLFVIAVGSRDEGEALKECLALGADAVLTKPLDMETLCTLVRRAIAGRQPGCSWQR